MNVYCDNYSVCNAILVDRNLEHAHAKGWHVWTGETLGGTPMTVILCPRCSASRRRDLPPAPGRLEGQLELFEDPGPAGLHPTPGSGTVEA
jgi:hypothetical protein